MKTLDLIFRAANGGTHHLKLADVQTELEADKVQEVMQQISAAGIFVDKNGVALYAQPISAVYIETQEDMLFTEEAGK